MLYTFDDGVLPLRPGEPPSPPSMAETENAAIRARLAALPPSTVLEAPAGCSYQSISRWRGEPFRARFAEACPALNERPEVKGVTTPFGDLPQLSAFAYPEVC